MHKLTWSLLVTAGFTCGLVIAGLSSNPLSGQRLAPNGAQQVTPRGQLIAIASPADVGQQLTLVAPHLRVMSVYQVDRATGQITLKSVRNVHWDMMMDEFNGVQPSPRDIRAMLHR